MSLSLSGLLTVNNLSVLSLIPVFDRIIYPFFHARGVQKSLLRRMIVGFVFVVLSMLVAGFVERERVAFAPTSTATTTATVTSSSAFTSNAGFNESQISPCQNIDDFSAWQYQQWSSWPVSDEDPPINIDQPAYCRATCSDRELIVTSEGFHYYALTLSCISCDSVPRVSTLSVLWQIPQFFLMGIAEVLTVVSALDFFYEQVPPSMRSVASACNLGTCALGAFLAVPVLCAVNYWDRDGKWVANDLDYGHLENYFFLLSGLMAADALLFWFYYMSFVERSFEYVVEVDNQIARKDHSPETSRHRSSSLTDLFMMDSASLASTSLGSNHFKHLARPFSNNNNKSSNVYSSLLSHPEGEGEVDVSEDDVQGARQASDSEPAVSVGVTSY